jgi:methionine-rich copper-binding protein CopC
VRLAAAGAALAAAGAALAAAAVRATSAAHARVFDAVPAEVVLAATDGLREVFANADLAPRAGAARGRRVSAGGY